MGYFNSDYALWKKISNRSQPVRKKVRLRSVRVGNQFWRTANDVVSAIKTADRKSSVPSGYTNAREGSIHFYLDPSTYVYIKAGNGK